MENEEYIEQETVDQGQPSSRTLKQNTGSIRQRVSEGVSTAAKATRGLGNAEKAAAVAAKASGKALKAGGKAIEAGGKAVEAGGKGIESGSNAAGQALSAIPYVGGVLGGIVKGVGTALGKGTQATGKGMQYGGKGMQKGGDALDKSSKKLEAKSKAHKSAAKKLDDFSKKVDNGNFGGNEGDKAKSAASQAASKTGKVLADKLKGLINPADPDRVLNKLLKRTLILIGVILFLILLMYAHISNIASVSDSKTNSELEDNIVCDGNIKLELLGKLEPPVKLEEGQLITFDGDTNFGYVGFLLHNGVDLTEKSTNTKAGDPVYSVYSDGEVIASTFDDTYPDKKVKGGWIKIRYLMTLDKDKYDFTITYGGISKDSLKLKTGDKVDKKQEIGKVGTADETEEGEVAGIHFGFFDNLSNRTLNPVNLFVPCSREGDGDDLKLHAIEISKSDFIKATQSYLNSYSGNCNSMKDWNLGDVYDTSSANNLNPEFVVIRAIKEGCSPVSQGYPSKNNYWGIGCYNGKPLSTCTSYSSLDGGISGLANLGIVKKSNTLVDLMYDYAYLGDVWLNPGGSGSGGCYYKDYVLPYINDPSRRAAIRNACESGNVCTTGKEVTCLKTKDGIYDDQKAYAQYNSKSMNELFKKIYSEYHY